MKTADLIDALARGVEAGPAEPKSPPWAPLLLGGLLGGLLLMVVTLGPRADLVSAMLPTFIKAALGAAIAAASLPLVARLARPGRPAGLRLAAFLILAVLALAAAIFVAFDAVARIQAARAIPRCLVYIPLFATPTAALLFWFVRGLAPTRLAVLGAAIGAVSGGIGAMAYAVYCPFENYGSVLSWYVMGIAICAVLGAVAGGRLLRW